jgi:phage-related protein
MTQRMQGAAWTFLCADPYAYETTTTSIDINAGAAACAMGTGLVRPVITIVDPPDDLVVIYRNGAGTEISRLSLTHAAATGTLVIDCDLQSITLDGADANDWLDVDTGGDFPVLDWRDVIASVNPTLELSPAATAASALAVYRRTWR